MTFTELNWIIKRLHELWEEIGFLKERVKELEKKGKEER